MLSIDQYNSFLDARTQIWLESKIVLCGSLGRWVTWFSVFSEVKFILQPRRIQDTMKRNIKGCFIIQHGQEVLHDGPQIPCGGFHRPIIPKSLMPCLPTWDLLRSKKNVKKVQPCRVYADSWVTTSCHMPTFHFPDFKHVQRFKKGIRYSFSSYPFFTITIILGVRRCKTCSAPSLVNHSTKGWWSCFP